MKRLVYDAPKRFIYDTVGASVRVGERNTQSHLLREVDSHFKTAQLLCEDDTSDDGPWFSLEHLTVANQDPTCKKCQTREDD